MTQPTLVNLHPDEYSQEFHDYALAVKYKDVLEIVILLMICLRFKSKRVQNDYSNKLIKNIKKPHIMQI